jgi:signal transduction histidine kinase
MPAEKPRLCESLDGARRSLSRRAAGGKVDGSGTERVPGTPLRNLTLNRLFRQSSAIGSSKRTMKDSAEHSDRGSPLADADCQVDTARRAAVRWLLSGVMHESRNALQQISAGAELLAIDLAGQPEALRLVQGIDDGQNRLLRMFEDLRLYASPQDPVSQSLDLAAQTRQVWHELTRTGRWPGAELREQLVVAGRAISANSQVRADRTLLGIGLDRLFTFVLGAAGTPAVVEFACRDFDLEGRPGTAVAISSPGLKWTAEEQQVLFEPFAVRRGRGTGFELAVARRVAEQHGGRLHAGLSIGGQAELVMALPR